MAIIVPHVLKGGAGMIVETRIFDLFNNGYNGYKSLSELAHVMGISVSQIYRVREGKRRINQKFIGGAIKAFPNHRLDDLFYLVPQSTTGNNNNRYQHSVIHSTEKPATKEKQIMEERTADAGEVYVSYRGVGPAFKNRNLSE